MSNTLNNVIDEFINTFFENMLSTTSTLSLFKIISGKVLSSVVFTSPCFKNLAFLTHLRYKIDHYYINLIKKNKNRIILII